MNRLIIIEGIPGSGKTTLAQRIAESLRAIGKDVNLYVEGDLHPTDMAWCACLTQEEYQEVCRKYPEYEDAFEKNKSQWNEYVILAYTKVIGLSEQLFRYFEQKEIYDGRRSDELFCEIHKSRWEKFGQEATGINIFECALLQNQVNELMLFHNADEETITTYIKALTYSVQRLNPMIVYLNPNINEVLERAAKERIDAEGNHIWEEGVAKYIADSPYGRRLGLIGTTGMQDYFESRRQMELRILEGLNIKKLIVSVDLKHQEEITREVVNNIVNSMKN